MKTIHCLFIFKEVLGENKMSSNILFPYQILQKGFVVAIVQYRDTSIAPFPAQIEDTKTAISF